MIQIYTGNGKGKTTAAIGLAIRASGAGMKVKFYQFLKGGRFPVSEEKILSSIANIKYVRFNEASPLFDKKITPEELSAQVKADLIGVAEDISHGGYNMIVLDELTHLINLGVADEKQIIKMLKTKTDDVEIIITGRNASNGLLKLADLVTGMKEIKDPYKKDMKAREGIEY
jgi:cob(I)alamin adenosyltransferase